MVNILLIYDWSMVDISLVGGYDIPLKHMSLSMGMSWDSQLNGKIKGMLQTTKQKCCGFKQKPSKTMFRLTQKTYPQTWASLINGTLWQVFTYLCQDPPCYSWEDSRAIYGHGFNSYPECQRNYQRVMTRYRILELRKCEKSVDTSEGNDHHPSWSIIPLVQPPLPDSVACIASKGQWCPTRIPLQRWYGCLVLKKFMTLEVVCVTWPGGSVFLVAFMSITNMNSDQVQDLMIWFWIYIYI